MQSTPTVDVDPDNETKTARAPLGRMARMRACEAAGLVARVDGTRTVNNGPQHS